MPPSKRLNFAAKVDKMETHAHHALIGLFTVVVGAAAMLFALWLNNTYTDSVLTDYEIIFNEAVTGLSKGSTVQYNGIKIGDVLQLKLDHQDPRRVLARIRIDSTSPIKEDTRAKLIMSSITGGVVIQLSSGSPQSPKLTAKNGKIPVIIADHSAINKLLVNSENLLAQINQLVNNANAIFSSENVDHISHTLRNIEQTTRVLAEQRNELRSTMRHLMNLSQQTRIAAEQTTLVMRNINGLVSHQGQEVFNSAQHATASLAHASETIDHLLSNNQEALNEGILGLKQLGPTVRELRETLSSIHSLTRRMEEDPTSYLLGREKPKEFEP